MTRSLPPLLLLLLILSPACGPEAVPGATHAQALVPFRAWTHQATFDFRGGSAGLEASFRAVRLLEVMVIRDSRFATVEAVKLGLVDGSEVVFERYWNRRGWRSTVEEMWRGPIPRHRVVADQLGLVVSGRACTLSVFVAD